MHVNFKFEDQNLDFQRLVVQLSFRGLALSFLIISVLKFFFQDLLELSVLRGGPSQHG